MPKNIAQKIIEAHLVEGKMVPGQEIAIKIDQTLLQDATGTVAMLEFEALGVPRVKVKRATVYVDHNTLQTGFENADDHLFLQTMAAKYGLYYSRPGNGISHQAHLERFDIPGQTMLGADSHTCQAGALGMIAIGTGGFEVALAMAGEPFHFIMPQIHLVSLKGTLPPWCSAKDVILELLRRCTVNGGLGKIFEFGGPSLKNLTVPQRSTIANMGAELGLTTSVFPADEQARKFMKAQKREKDFKPLLADKDAKYDGYLEVDLSKLEPLIAKPHSPDAVVPVKEIEGTQVRQVTVGSSVNSSYADLMTIAEIVKNKKISPGLQLTISPGSRQVLVMVTQNGALAEMIKSGARGLEVACGPCIGMGMAPPSGGKSVRTFNRNFPGRSGTADDQVYLTSPEVAAATALKGVITDPRKLGKPPKIKMPASFYIDDSHFLPPAKDPDKVEIVRGPNIQPLPIQEPLREILEGEVIIKLKDNISTDEILPAGAKILPLRSNIPGISEFMFFYLDPGFVKRVKEKKGGFIVAGDNYGQGSSREHAAIVPMYLGIRAVIAKSYARIHRGNLINFGILPLEFANPKDYELLQQGGRMVLRAVPEHVKNKDRILAEVNGNRVELKINLTERNREIILAGGLLNYIKNKRN